MATNPSDIISKNTRIRGEVSGSDPLVVQGTVEGEIHLANLLLIAADGRVDATVRAQSVSVEGSMKGSIEAEEQVTLRSGSTIAGDIRAPRVVIEGDAHFNGNLLMDVELPEGLSPAASTTTTR